MLDEEAESIWDQDSESASISFEELAVELSVEDEFMTANERYIYLESEIYNIGGTLMVPVRAAARILNLGVEWNDEDWSVDISDEEMAVPVWGEEYYDQTDL